MQRLLCFIPARTSINALRALLGSVLLFACAVTAAAADLRVMSFNIRVASADDGVNNWDNRKGFVKQAIQSFNPDLLGVQEDLKVQDDYLKAQLSGYTFFGPDGAKADGTGERVGILYKTSRFTKLRQGNYWLSLTPAVQGSVGWDAALPRQVTWVELRDKQNPSFSFIFSNTHWDHVGDTARFESAKLMRAKLTELAGNEAVIFTGDFNADQGGDAYRRMTGRDNGDSVRDLKDTYRTIHPDDSDTVGTAPGFDGVGGTGRIDWVLHDRAFQTIDADIDRTSYNGKYPSDHFPINAVIRELPEPGGVTVLLVVCTLVLMQRPSRIACAIRVGS
jgi:endonuclease/exonuclease/phosphatase family metal-dependent hydrolase